MSEIAMLRRRRLMMTAYITGRIRPHDLIRKSRQGTNDQALLESAAESV
jgi:hypothetical protein